MEDARDKIERILEDFKYGEGSPIPETADAILALCPQWISVEERLPEDEIYVLFAINGAILTTGYYSKFDGDYSLDDNRWEAEGWEVTHWQPLPAPPEEE
jgi:hypothetical protein